MKERCTVIGLTGQTGSGKTTVSRIFEDCGFFVIDCDKVARQVTEDASPCCKVLAQHFPACFDEVLHLDRRKLGGIVFSSKEKLELLNSLIFPFIIDEIRKRIDEAKERGSEFILLDAPTLYESGADKLCDEVVACVSDRETRIKRVIRRDRIDRQAAEERAESQQSEEFFAERADYLIENNGSLALAEVQALAAAEKIKKEHYGRQQDQKHEG